MTSNQHPEPRAGDELDKEAVDAVAAFCREMVNFMGLELELQARGEGQTVVVDLTGSDRPLLLANTASLLNSVEYIVNKVFRTGKDEEIATVVLDSSYYRKQREGELKLLAQIAAQKVRAQKRPLTLQPMSPRERRIVHLALAAIEGVRSQSDGEGDQRSITIHPAG